MGASGRKRYLTNRHTDKNSIAKSRTHPKATRQCAVLQLVGFCHKNSTSGNKRKEKQARRPILSTYSNTYTQHLSPNFGCQQQCLIHRDNIQMQPYAGTQPGLQWQKPLPTIDRRTAKTLSAHASIEAVHEHHLTKLAHSGGSQHPSKCSSLNTGSHICIRCAHGNQNDRYAGQTLAHGCFTFRTANTRPDGSRSYRSEHSELETVSTKPMQMSEPDMMLLRLSRHSTTKTTNNQLHTLL